MTARKLTVDQLILRSLQLASLRSAHEGMDGVDWQAYRSMALDFMEIELDSLQSEGVYARSVTLTDIAVSASEKKPSASADAMDIVGHAAWIYSSDTGSTTTQVRQISREMYMVISNKDTEGRPSQFFVDRSADQLSIYLWPVPSAAGTLTVQMHRHLADVDDGNSKLDLQPYWYKWAMWALAHELATAAGNQVNRLGYLNSKANEAKKLAIQQASQQPDVYMHIVHDRR